MYSQTDICNQCLEYATSWKRPSCMRHVGEDESCLSPHLSNLPYQQRKCENMSLQRGLFGMVRGLWPQCVDDTAGLLRLAFSYSRPEGRENARSRRRAFDYPTYYPIYDQLGSHYIVREDIFRGTSNVGALSRRGLPARGKFEAILWFYMCKYIS